MARDTIHSEAVCKTEDVSVCCPFAFKQYSLSPGWTLLWVEHCTNILWNSNSALKQFLLPGPSCKMCIWADCNGCISLLYRENVLCLKNGFFSVQRKASLIVRQEVLGIPLELLWGLLTWHFPINSLRLSQFLTLYCLYICINPSKNNWKDNINTVLWRGDIAHKLPGACKLVLFSITVSFSLL